MKSISRFYLSLLVLLAAYFALTAACLAGGSVGWDQVSAEVAKGDPFLADYIAKNFDVNHVGGAMRIGHDKDGNSLVPEMEVGDRIPPYEFYAKPRGGSGDYTLYITLDENSFDNGKTTLWVLSLRKRLPTDELPFPLIPRLHLETRTKSLPKCSPQTPSS